METSLNLHQELEKLRENGSKRLALSNPLLILIETKIQLQIVQVVLA